MPSSIVRLFDVEFDRFDYDLIQSTMEQISNLSKSTRPFLIKPDSPLDPRYFRDNMIKNDDSILGYGEYSSASNYFYRYKAVICDSIDLVPKTRRSLNPYEDALIPKEVYYEHAGSWEDMKIHSAFMANWLKFTQNSDLAEHLLATGFHVIESRTPRPWGTTFPTTDDRVNITGKILMIIREEIRRERARAIVNAHPYLITEVSCRLT